MSAPTFLLEKLDGLPEVTAWGADLSLEPWCLEPQSMLFSVLPHGSQGHLSKAPELPLC